jgi:hypothetical protein
MRPMVILISVPSGPSGVRHIPVSLPRIDALIADAPSKYALPPTGPDVRPPAAPVRGRGRWSHAEARYIEKRLG